MTYLFIALFLATFIIYRNRFSLFKCKRLTVLMYHKIDPSHSDRLTVTTQQFEEQLLHLKEHGYQPVTFSQVIDFHKNSGKLPEKPVIITFDDGYENNYQYLYPILQKYSWKASVFLAVEHIGRINSWDEGSEAIMTYERLKELDQNLIEFGLHSYAHKNFKEMTLGEIKEDTIKSMKVLNENNLPFVPVIAYPYGAYPRKQNFYTEFCNTLQETGIIFGLRIGNSLNCLPLKDPFCIKRVDVHGTDSFNVFKEKVRKGRVKIF